LPDGRVVDDYFVSQRPNVAIAVPLTAENNVILVRQYKHGVQAITLEFPGGTFRSESPDVAAARELEEETGYSPSSMMDLGTCFDDSSKNSNLVHIFLASGCVVTGKQRLDGLEAASGIEVVLMSLDEVIKALENGEIKSMSSVAAGYKALRAIGA
jgi:ADP-ribose pyrophosphatase